MGVGGGGLISVNKIKWFISGLSEKSCFKTLIWPLYSSKCFAVSRSFFSLMRRMRGLNFASAEYHGAFSLNDAETT